jgi:hypothetical protein
VQEELTRRRKGHRGKLDTLKPRVTHPVYFSPKALTEEFTHAEHAKEAVMLLLKYSEIRRMVV